PSLFRTSLAAVLVGALPLYSIYIYLLIQPNGPGVVGIVWKPDNATVGICGNCERLGARELLEQWSAVDGQTIIPGTQMPHV
ncbi:hypothetical protein RA269_28940, partial [Pseudomonas syringae pv. tagetis]